MEIKDELTGFLSELMATMLLIFVGCLGCLRADIIDSGAFRSALIFGLVVLVLTQGFGCISGAHMNPAVTLAAVIYQIVKPISGVVYFVGQILGGILGYGLLEALLPSSFVNRPLSEHGLCVTTISGVSDLEGLGIEFFITACWIFVWCSLWDPRNAKYLDSAAIKIGLSYAGLGAAAAQFTCGSMNPVRTLAPALWHFDFTDQGIYWIAHVLAAVAVPFLYKFVFAEGGGGGGGGGGGD